MAKSVVSCSACGKKFRVPDGAGDFDCTGCGELVSMGGGPGGRSRGAGVRERRRASEARRGGSNTGMIVGLIGLGCVLVVVVVLAVVMGGDKNTDAGSGRPDDVSNRPPAADPIEPPPRVDTPEVPDPVTRDPVMPDPEPEPEPEPGPEPEPEPKNEDIHYLSWPELSMKMRELEHVESTPASDRAKIDKLVALVMDFQSGGDGLQAQRELIRMGKPAVPMFLKGIAGLKFESIEDRAAAGLVDEALRRITNYTRQMELKPVIEKPALYKRVFKYHFIWWEGRKHLEGDKFREKSRDIEDDDEDW